MSYEDYGVAVVKSGRELAAGLTLKIPEAPASTARQISAGAMIELTHVSKSYNRGKVKAVDDLTLTVKPGEIFGFLGPNGAGKTTTIKMIVGLLRPDAGRIVVEGFDVATDGLQAKQVTTYVPDYPAVYERLTGLEYLNFIGDVYGVPKAERLDRIGKWLEIFELAPVVTNPIQSYSHGMKQKIVLTAALLPAPRVMVLDEPLVGLDPRAAHQLKEMFREHCDEGKTLFFSTHIMEVAEKLCDRIGIIHKGRLVACGTMEELKALDRTSRAVARRDLPGADRQMSGEGVERAAQVRVRHPGRAPVELRPGHPEAPAAQGEEGPLAGAAHRAAALGVVPMFYGIVLLIENVYLVLKPMGQERALLSFGILAGQLLILLFGIYYVIAAFYFSRDLEFLIPLPLRPSEVMASKFAVIVINEYLTVAAIVLPVVITVGVMAQAGIGYWVNAVLVYLALPVIPLAVVSLAVVAMMRFINVSRKKDALILVGSLVLIGLSFALQVGLGRSAGNGGPGASAQAVAAFFTSPDSLLNKVGAVFPPRIWATKAIAAGFSGEGLANLALLLGVSLALFAGMIVVAEKLFYRGLVGLGETTGKKRRLTRDEMSRRVSSGRRAFAAIFGREWKIMNRTPIFLLNGVLVSVFVPAIFVLMATIDAGGRGAAGREAIPWSS